MVQKRMLEYRIKAINQPFCIARMADNQGIWNGTTMEHWWRSPWKSDCLCTCWWHGFSTGKKSWLRCQEEQGLPRTCVHLSVILSLLVNTMTFRVQWLLLHFSFPSHAQISLLISFKLEPHREGNSGKHSGSLVRLTKKVM